MGNSLLGIGLVGKSLTDLERKILAEHSPYAVVLFGRNIQDVVQLRQLIAEVKAISKRAPLFMIDEEGGRVDRLRHIVPGLPSAEAFAEGDRAAEMSEWSGKVIGMALRYFGIENAWARWEQILARYRLPDRLCGGAPLFTGETPQQEDAGKRGDAGFEAHQQAETVGGQPS